MLENDRIDLSKRTDVNKATDSPEYVAYGKYVVVFMF